MKPLKTSDLRACDICGGSITPFFYRLKIQFRQLGIDRTAVNQVLGTAQIFGGNLRLGEMMSPNKDATIEMPGYRVDKDIFLCPDCVMGSAGKEPFTLLPLDLMLDSEDEDGEETP